MSVRITGLTEVMKKLDDIGKRAKEIGGTHNLSIQEILPPEFIRTITKFPSFDSMVEASGIMIKSAEDLKNEEWNAFIRSSTRFSTWEEILAEGVKEWTRKKLGL